MIDRILKLMPNASKDVTRYHLCGVLIELTDKEMKLVVCDGHRLIVENFNNEALRETVPQAASRMRFLVSRESLPVIKAMVEEYKLNTNAITFNMTGPHLVINSPNMSVTAESALNYPDYEKAIPNRKLDVAISFNPQYLYEMSQSLNKNKHDKIVLKFKIEKDNDGDQTTLGPIKVEGQNESVAIMMPCRVKKYEK